VTPTLNYDECGVRHSYIHVTVVGYIDRTTENLMYAFHKGKYLGSVYGADCMWIMVF